MNEIQTPQTKQLVNAIKYSKQDTIDFIVSYTCKIMDVDPHLITVNIFEDERDIEVAPYLSTKRKNGAAGLYENSLGQSWRTFLVARRS